MVPNGLEEERSNRCVPCNMIVVQGTEEFRRHLDPEYRKAKDHRHRRNMTRWHADNMRSNGWTLPWHLIDFIDPDGGALESVCSLVVVGWTESVSVRRSTV